MANAGSNGNDIFHGAGKLDAKHVLIGVQTKIRRGKFLLEFARQRDVTRREDDRSGLSGGDLRGERWPGKHHDARQQISARRFEK